MNGSRERVLGRLVVVQSDDYRRKLGGELGVPRIVVLGCSHDEVAAVDGEQHGELTRLALVERLREEDAVCVQVYRVSFTHAHHSPSGIVRPRLTGREAAFGIHMCGSCWAGAQAP